MSISVNRQNVDMPSIIDSFLATIDYIIIVERIISLKHYLINRFLIQLRHDLTHEEYDQIFVCSGHCSNSTGKHLAQ